MRNALRPCICYLLVAILNSIALLSVNAAAQSPTITGISPSNGVVGMEVHISGSGFGGSPGSSSVSLNGTSAVSVSWSDSTIAIIVPNGASTGPISVTVGGQTANSASFTVEPLPSGWSDADVGSVGTAGSASFGNGVFTVNGAGTQINGTADSFNFAYQSLSGDGSIVARVVSATAGAMVGVMVRETMDQGATNAATVDQLYGSSSLVQFDYRSTTGATTSSVGDAWITLPYWVEVVRSGSTFTSYTSADGVNWTQLGSSQTISMATNVYVGLAVTSGSTSSLATVTFDNVSVSSAAAPAPVITSVSATTGNVSSQVTISGSGFGASEGGSVVTLNAVPVTINSWSDASITATIPTGATTGLLVVSVAPSMNDSNPVWFTVTSQPLPSGWVDGDVGVVGQTGSATYASGVFTVNGAGNGMGGTVDAFHIAYQPLSGDGSIVARVVSATSGATAGVMVRETLSAGGTYFYTELQPYGSNNLIGFYDRTTTGASGGQPTAAWANAALPYWVEVVRSGSTFTSYTSADGVNWTQLGSSQTISMATNVYVGLAVTSGSTSSLATVTFDNVSVSSAAAPAPVITSVSATTGNVSSQVTISGSGFGASEGGSVVTLNAVPVTINSWSDASITATIPTGATTGLLVVSVAPSMNDSNPVWFTVTSQPLPSGWVDGDVGVVGQTGSATYASGVFTVNGAGNGMGGTVDAFHIAYQPLSGDGSIVARVVSATSGATAGVMVRETLSAGGTYFYTELQPYGSNNLIGFYDRTTTGASGGQPTAAWANAALPYWVEVVRSGSTFTSYTSADGVNWTQLGSSQTISMATNVYVGLAVTSGSTSSLATVTFDNVSTTFSSQSSSPLISSISPATAVPGASVTISGTNFGSSPGTVTFNGTAGTPTYWSTTGIAVPVPMAATSGNVLVSVSGVASNGVPFTVSPTPTINNVSPTSGPPGTSVTVSGVNFGSPHGSSTITFNGTPAGPTTWGPTSILVPVPSAATTGNIVVTTSNGTSSGVPFTVMPVPSITSLSGSSATIGSLITITGTNFGSIQGSSTVTFNGVAGMPTNWSPTSIAVPVPEGATTGNVVVTENGLASNAVSLSIVTLSLPQVAEVLPANGSSGFPENGRIVVRFAQPVQSVAIIPGTVTVSQGSSNVTGNLALSNDGLSVTFTPSQNLAANTSFNVAVTDLAGNQTTAQFQSSFASGSTTDAVAPSIVQTSPQNSNTGVPTSAPVVVQFSKPMDPATLTPQNFSVEDGVTGQTLAGMVQVDATGTTASFVPQVYLGVDRTFYVSLNSAIEDSSGNNLTGSGAYFSFTSSFSADTTAPQMLGTSPSRGATTIPLNALIVLQFSKPLDIISVSKGLQVQSGGQPITGGIALSNSNQRVTFTPLGGLAPSTSYSVVTSNEITDVGGLALSNPGSTSFTTGSANDTTTPSVNAVNPANQATGFPTNGIVQLQFSKPVDPLTVTSSTFQLITNVTSVGIPQSGTVSVSADGLTATFTPNGGLNSYTTYWVEPTSGITDLEGNALSYFASSFTTGSSGDTSSPTVQLVSPANSATGVPVNVRIDVVVNTPLEPASVNNSSVVVSAAGTSVPGNVSLGSNGTTLTYMPSTNLSAGTTYAVNVSGVTDQAGNSIIPFTSGFTTSTSGTANTTQPSVTSATPANGATGIAVNVPIVLVFNEPIDMTTVTDTTVPISVNGISGVLAGGYSVDSTGTILSFTPASALPANSTVVVQVNSNGVLDLSGDGSSSYYGTFSTGSGTDSSAPTVVMATPANGSNGVAVNSPVVLTFSKSLNPSTINTNNFGLLENGSAPPQGFGINVSADNRVVTLNPSGMPGSSAITVLATSGVTDLYGNSLASFQSQFNTGPTPTATTPYVVSQHPGSGATGVPISDSVVLYFSQPMNTASVTGAVNVAQNGVLVGGSIHVSDNGQVVQFIPSTSLQAGALVQVYVTSSAQGMNGVNINNYQSSFTTQANASTIAPTEINTNPANSASNVPTNAVIDLGFSAALDPATLTETAVQCLQNGAWFQSEVSLIAGGTVVQLAPRLPLQPNTAVTCQVSTNLQGTNGVASQGGGLSFTTGSGPDTVTPTITTVSPPNGLTQVGDNAYIRLVFSKPVNPLTVSASTIQLSGGGTTVVPDSISFSNNNQMVLVVPHAPLPDNTVMTLTISGITDVAGNPVASQTTQFTTGSGPDVVGPMVVWTSPLQTNPYQVPSNVPLNAIVQVQVNEPVDPGTVNSSTFSIVDPSNTSVNGTYAVSADGLTITFVPSAPLLPNQQYRVYALGGITDLAGNYLSSAVNNVMGNFSFTTGESASASAPQVVGISPANGTSGIPINAQVAISFNEPINAAQLGGVTLTGSGSVVNTSQNVNNGNQTVVLIPSVPLAAGTQYTINVAGIQDFSGNVLSAPVTASFTTGSSADLTPPSMASESPSSGATGVSTNATVQIQFSKAIDPLTATPTTFQLYPNSTDIPVAGTFTSSSNNQTLTFTPTNPLDSLTLYDVRLTSGITDMEGQGLTGTSGLSFTTAQGTTSLAPNMAAVNPPPANGAVIGATVTIDGSYFGTSQGSSTVTFNGIAATATEWSDAQVIVTVPSGATTGPLVVTVNGTASNSVMFTVTYTPVITNILPSPAPVGTVLTITGSNFGNSSDTTQVQFNANVYPAPLVTPLSRNETSLTVAIPSTSVTGNVYVLVDGVASPAVSFTVLPTPTISQLSPASGVVGTPVSIYGANFGGSQGSSTLTFNGVAPASITTWSDSYILAYPPSNVTTGPVSLVVDAVPSNNAMFTVTDPAIGSLMPPAAAIGATITLTGSGLASQGLTTTVLFNGISATVSSASSNSLSVQVPANATSGNVTVEVGSVSSNSVPFTVEQPPTITSLSRNYGPFGDDNQLDAITINGTGFGATQSNSSVIFYGSNTAPTIQSWSDTSITLGVPLDATTGPLTMQVGGLIATAPLWFYVNQITNLTDSLGNQTQYTFDIEGGRWFTLTSQGPGCGTCTVRGNITNTADSYGNILTSTDDLGNTMSYTYDSTNDMTSASKPLNVSTTQTTAYTYNTFGEVLTMTDPLGNVTTNSYDPRGNLLTITSPAPTSSTPASTTQFQYAPNGEMTQITDPKGNVTILGYNSVGLIASITDAQNNVTSYQYDARGNRTAVIDPINGTAHPTSFTYDIMSRLTGITYPDGSTVGFTYDVRGRRITATDQNGKTTQYTYDDADRLTAVTDPANNITQYAYDTESNLLSITDANNHTTQFAYNARGWVTQTTFPSTLTESYTYDAVGNLLSKTDRKGNTIQYLYDALYRLTQKTYPDQTAVEYAYDLAGKVQQVSDPTGVYGFAYDNMGRLIGTSTQYSYLPSLNFQNAYTYDAASNRTSLTAPDGTTTTYGYDTLNRLNGLGNSWAGSFAFGYDALSRRTSLTRPNSVNTSYSYDGLSHLLSVLHQAGNTVLDGASYMYDPAGNRTAKTNNLNGITSSYSYDPLYELTQVTQGTSTTESYSYDAVGNRLSSSGVPTYNYNSANELTSNSSGSYTYDANGNTLTDPSGKSYSWDFENRLTQAVVPGTGTVNFKYDPFGKRIYKQSPTATSIFAYDGPNLIETTNGSGGEVASYTQTRTTDETLAELRGSTSDYYQADGLGSITSLSSATGAVANTYTYDSFGNTTASTGTLRNYFQYTGREFDPETGIYEYRARYYDPRFGRFLSEDPLGFQVAPNFYPYVANDPMGHIDPSGLCPCNSHKVKLYYTPNYGGSGYPDYHWYRQDSNGGWSSKHGWAPVGPQVNPGNDAAASGYGVFCANMCAPNQNGTAPVYNPVPWNDPQHIHTNNCYSYACDRLHPPGPDTRPQPGGHNPPANFGCIDIINAAQSDGLTLDYDVPRP